MNAGLKAVGRAATLGALALPVALLARGGPAISADGQAPGKEAPPLVKITAPSNNSTHEWNSLVSYSIVVSYQGRSTVYQEIPAKRVLLQATYVPDLAALAGRAAAATAPAPVGLLDVVDSNCLGCHDFKAKAMGPSFAAIAERYPDSPATIGVLSQHIRVGSSGVWGQGSMPSHEELTDGQLHDIVLWILKDAADPTVSYYVGTQGTIRMQASGAPGTHGGMVLTARYTSPAPADHPEQAAYGKDTVILRGNSPP